MSAKMYNTFPLLYNDKTQWHNITYMWHKTSHACIINTVTQKSLIHQFGFAHLSMKELLEHIGALVVISVRLVKWPAVCEQSCHVSNKQVLVNVIVTLQAIAYRLQICRKNFTRNHNCISFCQAIYPWIYQNFNRCIRFVWHNQANTMFKILISFWNDSFAY